MLLLAVSILIFFVYSGFIIKNFSDEIAHLRASALLAFAIAFGLLTTIVLFRKESGQNYKDRVKSVWTYIKGEDTPQAVVNLFLVGLIVFATWLTVRVGGHLTLTYMVYTSYSANQIIELAAYVLLIYFCFSLIQALKERSPLRLIGAGIQAVVIGVLIFVQQDSSDTLLTQLKSEIWGVVGYFIIAAAIVIILLSLLYGWKVISPNAKDNKEK